MLRSSLFFYLYDTENVFHKYRVAEKHEEDTDLCACGGVTRGEMILTVPQAWSTLQSTDHWLKNI